jgi:uncharacterized cupredoxin-like copper-binding protein
MKNNYRIYLSAIALLTSVVAHAHDDTHPAAPRKFNPAQVETTAFGQEGDPAKVSRTIRIAMDDKMRFVPGTLTVQKGETVRLRVTNRGAQSRLFGR